ncbi:protein ALP1-like [Anoplophora glabripennis]|uniref:protein ALP1-like n=1 Tax=Anoplophora glabripennis TaxID=217634 RepID=UPI000C75EB62|nr:protein ALP1-like [Anoplophora glabripennis]
MDVDTYTNLLELVKPYITKENTCMRTAISPHERLTATLRFLATGRSYKDLEFTTIMSKQSLSEIVPETCEAIYNVLRNVYMKFPKTEAEWLEVATEFERKWRKRQFPHCLGSIDGKHVKIVPPKGSGSYYFNYKKTHSIVLMAIANANCEFLYCDVGTNGRISDGGVINNNKFFEKLVNNELRIPGARCITNSKEVLGYVFIGDEAFAMRPELLKPYRREALTKERRIFNYRLSRGKLDRAQLGGSADDAARSKMKDVSKRENLLLKLL